MKVQVSQLQPGDVMMASKEKVLAVSAGIRTPSRCLEVTLERPATSSHKGGRRTATWNKATMVNIEEKVQ